MNWSDERYVRLYTRDTPDWLMLPWQARALLPLLMRKLDRAGVLELGRHGMAGLAALLTVPLEVAEAGVAGLLADGCLVRIEDRIVLRNFVPAQEAATSDRLRQKESRERRRSVALSQPVTPRPSCHDLSLQPSRAVPSQPSLASTAVKLSSPHGADPTPRVVAVAGERTLPGLPPPVGPTPGYVEFIAAFDSLYHERTGTKPTWGAKQGAQAKRLLKARGLPECLLRMSRLFSGALPWLTGTPDLSTLVQHFDKLAEDKSPDRPLTAREIAQQAADDAARGH